MPFASRRFRPFARPALVITTASATAALLAFGCGGNGHTGTGGGTFGGGGAGTTHQHLGGNGGELFNPTVGSSSSGSTSSGSMSSSSGAGGSMPVCDGNPTTGPVKWAVKNSDDAAQFGVAVAADPSGKAIIAGSYSKGAPITFGSLPAGPVSAYNAAFVAKVDESGAPVWVKGFPVSGPPPGNGPPLSTARAVATDGQGNVYVAGEFTGTISFGGTSLASTGGYFGDAYLLKLDPSGAVVWAKRIGETPTGSVNGPFGTQAPRAIALHQTATGYDVAVGGDTQGKVDLDNGSTILASNTASAAAFVAVFRSGDGSAKLGLGLGDGSTEQSVHGLAWDASGDLVVTGHAKGPITFPGMAALTPAGTQAAFVAKIKGDGSATTWAKLYGAGTAGGEGVAVSPSGGVFVAGNHKGDVDFGGGVLGNDYGDNVFVASLDAAGNALWSHTYGDSMSQQAHGISVDAMGRAVVAGEFTGNVDFGGGSLQSAGNGDVFVVKLDTHGCQVWAKTFGDAKQQAANAVSLDAMGNVFIAGNLGGSVMFGGTTLTSNDTNPNAISDAFLAKIGP